MVLSLQLLAYMVNLICDYEQNVNDYTEEDISNMFDSGDDIPLDDFEFVTKYVDTINMDMCKDMWNYLVAGADITDKDLDIIKVNVREDENYQFTWDFALSEFAIYDILANYKDESVLNYYDHLSLHELKDRFFNDEDYASSLIMTYFKTLVKEDYLENTREEIKKDENTRRIFDKWDFGTKYKVMTINNILRDVLKNLYGYYKLQGSNDDAIGNYLWAFFRNNFDPLNSLKERGFDDKDLLKLKKYMLKMMLADLYEDALNYEHEKVFPIEGGFGPVMHEIAMASIREKNAGIYFKFSQEKDYYKNILTNPHLKKVLFRNYVFLLSNTDRLIENRKKTILENRTKELSLINPLWKLDF